MPPSQSLRFSPGKGPRRDSHKRGWSLESGLSFKEKDDDLALFSEMQNKEQQNFLLQPTDDLEDIFSTKLNPFPDLKLGIAIPARGESSELLNADGDKNEYDWLFAPPDTPLFPSLDDEPIPANLMYSGRPRSRPLSFSRSSTMEKNYRSSRGSASPQRLSQSPRSSVNTTFQSRGRPTSAPRLSPSPSLRHRTPTRRPSPPPVKPSTPPPRSSTPTPRRSSAGSGTAVSSGIRGTSPVRSSRGTSSSPKIMAWQSNIPGFSLEAPPNLRTSLADHPASFVRGSSPASRNGRDSSSKFRRQSMSPTATRSISSSHSHERDRFSSHSKGSVASSVDDDAESLLSAPVRGSENSLSQRVPNNRQTTLSKKPTKTFSPSSGPKRSFDSAIRQMERKSPHNMFRPLISCVPSTTFHDEKANSSHHTAISINSSITTSSNASSDQVVSGVPDTEGSEHGQDDLESERQKISYAEGNDETFASDKMDAVSEDSRLEIHDRYPDVERGEYHKASAFESKPGEIDEFHLHDAADMIDDYVDGDTLLCAKCRCRYNVTELVEDDGNLCPECKQKEGIVVSSTSSSRVDAPLNSSVSSVNISMEVGSPNAPELYLAALESSKVMEMDASAAEFQIVPGQENERESSTYQDLSTGSIIENPYLVSEGKARAPMLSDVQIPRQVMTATDPSDDAIHELHNANDDPFTKFDVAEGAGISVLLSKRPCSSKGPVIQGRSFTATAVSYDVRSYARESTTRMRSSIGYGSVSTSSSIDLSSRNAEMSMQRQLSGRKSDSSSKPDSIGSSFLQTSSYISQGLGLSTSTHEENVESFIGIGCIVGEEHETPDPAVALENAELDREASLSHLKLLEGDNFDTNSQAKDSSALELSTDVTHSESSSSQQLAAGEECNLLNVDDDPSKKVETNMDMNDSAAIPESSLVEESAVPDFSLNQMEVSEAPHGDLATTLEIEIYDCHPSSPGSQNDMVTGDASHEHLASSLEAKDVHISASPSNDPEAVHGILSQSTVMVQDQQGRHTRSLTLEEATDTILFCSSLIHNLAYEAASIAIEKEKENLVPLEGLRPTVTIVGKPSSDPYPHGQSPSKRTPKAHKIKRRRRATETDLSSINTETVEDDKPGGLTIRNVGLPHEIDSTRPPKLESKCNCTIM